MADLYPPPPKLNLPLSKGGDLDVSFIYKPGDVEDDWPIIVNDGSQAFTVDVTPIYRYRPI